LAGAEHRVQHIVAGTFGTELDAQAVYYEFDYVPYYRSFIFVR